MGVSVLHTLHSGDSLMKRSHSNVQKEPKVCALSAMPISGFVVRRKSSRLCRLDPPYSPWLIPIRPQAIGQLTLLFPTSLQYSRQRQTTTRLSRDKIYEPIHWLPSSRVTAIHLIPSWVYFESKHNLSISFATAMTS